jgi:uncharacterized Zn finger protein (UPF0148 family)
MPPPSSACPACGSHVEGVLANHHAAVRQMARRRVQQRAPRGAAGRVEEVAPEQHRPESPPELERLDRRVNRLDSLDEAREREHRLRLVDSDHAMAQLDEPARHATRAAAELEHLGAGRHRPVHHLRLAEAGQQGVQLDRAPVAGCGHGFSLRTGG